MVEYNVLGKYWDREFIPGNAIEKIPFEVIKTDTGWKITNLSTTVPHIFPKVILERLECMAGEERDLKRLEQIRKDIILIKKLEDHNLHVKD